MSNSSNQEETPVSSNVNNNFNKLKFNFQSLDLYNRLNSQTKLLKKKAFEDSDFDSKLSPGA